MHVVEIIPYRRWVNDKAGRTASICGSLPYTSEAERADWRIDISGYTWRMSNNTRGFGRPPAKTLQEAIDTANKFNDGRPGAPTF